MTTGTSRRSADVRLSSVALRLDLSIIYNYSYQESSPTTMVVAIATSLNQKGAKNY
jgi:hypothetical protein